MEAGKGKEFRCKLCDYVRKSNGQMYAHLHAEHENQIAGKSPISQFFIEQPAGTEPTGQGQQLGAINLSEQPEQHYKCTICELVFPQAKAASMHVRTAHKKPTPKDHIEQTNLPVSPEIKARYDKSAAKKQEKVDAAKRLELNALLTAGGVPTDDSLVFKLSDTLSIVLPVQFGQARFVQTKDLSL